MHWLRWAVLALVILGVAAVAFSGIGGRLTLSELRDRREAVQAFVGRHPVLSLEIYAVAYAVVIGFSIPGALAMSLGGGYLFGVLAGGATAILGETVGATAMFLAARVFGATLTGRLLKPGRLWTRVVEAVRESPFSGLLMLRLIPAMPFTLVNLAAGLVRMPVRTYVAATVIGIAPSTFVYAWIGQGLGVALNRNGVPKPSSLVRSEVYLPLVALGAMGVGVFLLQVRHKRRRAAASSPAAPPTP